MVNGADRQDLPSVHEPSGGVAQLLEADDVVEERKFDEGGLTIWRGPMSAETRSAVLRVIESCITALDELLERVVGAQRREPDAD